MIEMRRALVKMLTLGWTWGKLRLCSTLRGTSETARSATPVLQVDVPGWISQVLVAAPAPEPGCMGAATRLSVHGGYVQAKVAFDDSSAPTYRDNRGSKPREPSGIMEKLIEGCKLWPDLSSELSLRSTFTTTNWCLPGQEVRSRLFPPLNNSISVLVCLAACFLCFFHPFLSPLVRSFSSPHSLSSSFSCCLSVPEVGLAQIPR